MDRVVSARLPKPLAPVAAAVGFLRYRFFLVAGVFPYLLGAAVAYHDAGAIHWPLLWLGLMGAVAVSAGVEGMNEHFDSLHGGDRVFARDRRVRSSWPLTVGIAGFATAFGVGLCLVSLRGWPILAFALAGGLAALSYLAPPVHLSYRGLGEIVIALSYGPGLTLGGYYLQTGELRSGAALVSLLPALTVLSMALVNEVPDYYGDRLVGKRNLVVRLGRRTTARLYGVVTLACFGVVGLGLGAGVFPPTLWVCLLPAPFAFVNAAAAVRDYESPVRFRRVVRGAMLVHAGIGAAAILGYVWQ